MRWRRALPPAEPAPAVEPYVWKTWADSISRDSVTRGDLIEEALRHADLAGQAADNAASDTLNDFPAEAAAFTGAALAASAASRAYSELLGVLRPGDLPLDNEGED